MKNIFKSLRKKQYSPRDMYDKNYFKTLLDSELILIKSGRMR